LAKLKNSTIMAPKGKGAEKGAAAKGKGKAKGEEKKEEGGKVKGAQFVNVRHILVRILEDRRRNLGI
jgi:hypothetical protein